jgi:uncharacterized membrane protein YedE/YeeE
MKIIDFISQPWPWYVAGPIISVIMFSLLLTGNRFGISSNLRTICSILGAGKSCEYFDFDWKSQKWNLVFALGMLIGGAIAAAFLTTGESVQLSAATLTELDAFGVSRPNGKLVPAELFSWSALLTAKGIIMLVLGGFLVGFGTRYAGGCTSSIHSLIQGYEIFKIYILRDYFWNYPDQSRDHFLVQDL